MEVKNRKSISTSPQESLLRCEELKLDLLENEETMKVEIIKNTCDPEQMRPCKNELHSPCFCTSNHPGPCKRQDETGSALEQLDSWYLSSEILSEVHDWKSWSICLTAWKARGRSLESGFLAQILSSGRQTVEGQMDYRNLKLHNHLFNKHTFLLSPVFDEGYTMKHSLFLSEAGKPS